IGELATDRLLSMTWLEGEPLMKFVDDHIKSRNAVAHNMFRAWYVPFYFYGGLHGDPHLGNYTVRPDATINLMDFGCVRVFKPSFVGAVIKLYKALREGGQDRGGGAHPTRGG